MRNPYDCRAGATPVTDHLIGNAYPVVRDVQRHLAEIIYVAQNMDKLVPKDVTFRYHAPTKMIQWSYVGSTVWNDLAPIPELDDSQIVLLQEGIDQNGLSIDELVQRFGQVMTTTQSMAYIGSVGTTTIDSTLKTLRVHDGTSPGGNPLAKVSDLQFNPTDWLGSVSRSIQEDMRDRAINVRQFGAKGEWNSTTRTGPDDTNAFTMAAAIAKVTGRRIFVPARPDGFGYYVNKTILLGHWTGASIYGDSPTNSRIFGDFEGDTPMFLCQDGSGTATGIEVVNLGLWPVNIGGGTAVRVEGTCFARIFDIHGAQWKYGIDLLNGRGPGTFTELTQINRVWMNYCDVNLRLGRTIGDNSMHGTTIDNFFCNVGPSQVGLHVEPGIYLYNSRINMRMWSGNQGTYILNEGNVEHCHTEFTFEGPGKIDNRGRWHSSGTYRGIIPGEDISNPDLTGSGLGMILDNYFQPQTPTAPTTLAQGITFIHSLDGGRATNGMNPMLVGMSGPNASSVAVVVYNGSSNSGFGIAASGYQAPLRNTVLYHHFGLSQWTTHLTRLPINVSGQPSEQLVLNANGKVNGVQGKGVGGVIPAQAGVGKTIQIVGANYGDRFTHELASVYLSGDNFEWRGTFVMNANGFGAGSTPVLIATHFLNNSTGGGCSFPENFALNSIGELTFNIVNDRPISYFVKNVGIGTY